MKITIMKSLKDLGKEIYRKTQSKCYCLNYKSENILH